MIKGFDYGKCVSCGRCIKDCITNYIVADGLGKPVLKERGRCIGCGHCYAGCPVGAVIFDCVETAVADDELLKLMSLKRTVRHYKKGAEIEKGKLEKILFAAQSAPTEKNRMTGRIILVKDKLKDVYNLALDYLLSEVERTGAINPMYVQTKEMNEHRDILLWNAEYLVLFVGSPVAVVDAAISAERMQLEASSLGVGTGYRGDMKLAINSVEKLKELLGIKKNEKVLVSFAMGIPENEYLRPAVKYNRKVEWL